MKTQQQTETYTTTTETRAKQTEGRVRWSRPTDFAWGGGATILTALLLWLLFGAGPAGIAAPVVTAPLPGAIVAADQPVIVAGSAVPNQRINIVGNDQPLGDVTTGADGNFNYELTNLAPGAYNMVVNAVDDAGQEIATSAPVTFTVSGPRVAAPVAVLPNDQMPVVHLPEGGLTFDANDARTISGAGVPGSRITILNGATSIAETLVDTAGNWSLQLPALDPGAYRLTLKQRLPDDQEATLPEPLEVSLAGLKAPQLVMPVEGLRFEPGQPITLKGTGVPGATVAVMDAAGNVLSTAPVDAAGMWTLTLPALDAGDYTWNVTQTTAEGQEVAMARPLAFTVGESSVAATNTPIAPGAQPAVTRLLSGVLLPAGQPIKLEGTGAPGATIIVSDATGQPLGKAVVDALGAWTLTLPAPATGDHQWTVTQITTEGVQGALLEPLAMTVAPPEFIPPEVTKPGTDLNAIAGATLMLEGIGQPGAAIAITEGATVLAEVKVGPIGAWQAEITGLTPGLHRLNLTQTTEDGAESVAALPVNVTVVAAAPTSTPGSAATGAKPVVAQPAQVIRGAAPAGAAVEVYAGDAMLGTAVADANGAWKLVLPAGMSFKANELTLKARNASGAPLGEGEAGIILDAPVTLPVTGGRR